MDKRGRLSKLFFGLLVFIIVFFVGFSVYIFSLNNYQDEDSLQHVLADENLNENVKLVAIEMAVADKTITEEDLNVAIKMGLINETRKAEYLGDVGLLSFIQIKGVYYFESLFSGVNFAIGGNDFSGKKFSLYAVFGELFSPYGGWVSFGFIVLALILGIVGSSKKIFSGKWIWLLPVLTAVFLAIDLRHFTSKDFFSSIVFAGSVLLIYFVYFAGTLLLDFFTSLDFLHIGSYRTFFQENFWRILIIVLYPFLMAIPVLNRVLQIVTLEPLLLSGWKLYFLRPLIVSTVLYFAPMYIERYNEYKARRRSYDNAMEKIASEKINQINLRNVR